MADEPHAPCLICGDPVLRREGEPLNKWLRRLACCPLHSKQLQGRRTIDLPPKDCVICDIEFTAREDETARGFMARQTCGAEECKSQLQSQNSNRNGQHCDPVKWHIETGPIDYAGGFGRASIDPGDKRGSIPLRPATHVATEANT